MMTFPKDVNPILIGITGLKQAGKNTVASILSLEFHTKTQVVWEAFATGFKKDVAEAFGITLAQLEERKTNPIVRHCLQWVGTENGRDVEGEDVWIKSLNSRLPATSDKRLIVFITDLRFLNEAQFIKDMGGAIITIERVGQVNTDMHPSEVEVSKISPDWRVYNDGKNLTALGLDCKYVAGYIKERYGI